MRMEICPPSTEIRPGIPNGDVCLAARNMLLHRRLQTAPNALHPSSNRPRICIVCVIGAVGLASPRCRTPRVGQGHRYKMSTRQLNGGHRKISPSHAIRRSIHTPSTLNDSSWSTIFSLKLGGYLIYLSNMVQAVGYWVPRVLSNDQGSLSNYYSKVHVSPDRVMMLEQYP